MSAPEKFCSPEKYQVLIPYSDLERMVEMAKEMEEMKKQLQHIDEQYTAIRGMFSECLEKIKDIRDFVQD